MKKIIFLLTILLIPIGAKADCITEQTAKLKAIASNVNVTYDYIEQDNSIIFSVTLHNVSSNLKVRNQNTGLIYKITNDEIVINNIKQGTTFGVEILSNDKECRNKQLTIKHVTTPYYNKYYNDDLCKGNETKEICQKWVNTLNLTYDEFQKTFKKEEQEIIQPEEKKETLFDILGELFVNYYYVLFSTIIVVCLIIIYTKNKKDSFNF